MQHTNALPRPSIYMQAADDAGPLPVPNPLCLPCNRQWNSGRPMDIVSGMLDWNTCDAVERSPLKVSGAWVFKGTRLPVEALFENIEDGATISDFLAWFPGVTREQVQSVLTHAQRSPVEA
jgi:uncharacterized protein (DUF433 family)